jgi:hypothetical protein
MCCNEAHSMYSIQFNHTDNKNKGHQASSSLIGSLRDDRAKLADFDYVLLGTRTAFEIWFRVHHLYSLFF